MSNEVKRYDPINSDGTCGMCIEDADYGAYVEYADYAALEAELAKLRAELERRAADVSAMARVLSDRAADACNIDCDDNWAMYGQEYIDDVQAMLAAVSKGPDHG